MLSRKTLCISDYKYITPARNFLQLQFRTPVNLLSNMNARLMNIRILGQIGHFAARERSRTDKERTRACTRDITSPFSPILMSLTRITNDRELIFKLMLENRRRVTVSSAKSPIEIAARDHACNQKPRLNHDAVTIERRMIMKTYLYTTRWEERRGGEGGGVISLKTGGNMEASVAPLCVSPGDIFPNPDVIKADYSGELICKLMHTPVLYNWESIRIGGHQPHTKEERERETDREICV